MFALLSTPGLAQEAAAPALDGPIVNVPPAATPVTLTPATPVPAAEPSPVLVVPDLAPAEEPAPASVTAAVPAAEPQAAAPARAAPAEPAATPQAAAVAAPAEPASEPLAAAPDLALQPPVVAEEAATPAVERTGEEATDMTALLALALIALLGLVAAIFVFAALRRRGPAARRAAAAVTREPAPRPVAAVAEPAPLGEPVAAFDRAPSRPLRSTGAAVPLPARMPRTFEERDALLKRMLDAPPDRANPFTGRRARLKRARLILQSLGRGFERAKPWIDLSDYPENWPALARRAPTPTAPARTRELEPA